MSESKFRNPPSEDMQVTLELENDLTVTCDVVTIISVDKRDYIALLPDAEEAGVEDGTVWLYRYHENPDDPNEEPVLDYIDDDEEYERVDDAFDEFLDSIVYDDMGEDD